MFIRTTIELAHNVGHTTGSSLAEVFTSLCNGGTLVPHLSQKEAKPALLTYFRLLFSICYTFGGGGVMSLFAFLLHISIKDVLLY